MLLGSVPKVTSGRKPVLYKVVLYSWYLVLRDSQRNSWYGSISQRKRDQGRRRCLFIDEYSDGSICESRLSAALLYLVCFHPDLFSSYPGETVIFYTPRTRGALKCM